MWMSSGVIGLVHICLHPYEHRWAFTCLLFSCMYMDLCLNMCVHVHLSRYPKSAGQEGQGISPAPTACTGFAPGGL